MTNDEVRETIFSALLPFFLCRSFWLKPLDSKNIDLLLRRQTIDFPRTEVLGHQMSISFSSGLHGGRCQSFLGSISRSTSISATEKDPRSPSPSLVPLSSSEIEDIPEELSLFNATDRLTSTHSTDALHSRSSRPHRHTLRSNH